MLPAVHPRQEQRRGLGKARDDVEFIERALASARTAATDDRGGRVSAPTEGEHVDLIGVGRVRGFAGDVGNLQEAVERRRAGKAGVEQRGLRGREVFDIGLRDAEMHGGAEAAVVVLRFIVEARGGEGEGEFFEELAVLAHDHAVRGDGEVLEVEREEFIGAGEVDSAEVRALDVDAGGDVAQQFGRGLGDIGDEVDFLEGGLAGACAAA